MKESLSIEQARKLVILSQGLPPKKQAGTAIDATLAAIEHLGYIQIDTISIIQRAHHHTLWNRNPRYKNDQLDQLIADHQVFEYWSHAAAYLPMRDFRFSLPRKQAIANGDEHHWTQRNPALLKTVLQRITDEGPLMAKDFAAPEKPSGTWGGKPARMALEALLMQGKLMVPSRVKFHKVYDLTERVLSDGIDRTMPSSEETARFLITRFLRANGVGQPAEIAYLLKGMKPLISQTMQEMLAAGELQQIRIGEQIYHALPASLERLGKPLNRKKLKILSPFDNLLIQRKRMRALFEFDYLLECYVPKAKRQYGYFSLPILWDGRLVARMDCKADRKQTQLQMFHLALEPSLSKSEAFFLALRKELESFLKYNGCATIRIHKTSPARFKAPLRKFLADLA